jgi:hypothetical protein
MRHFKLVKNEYSTVAVISLSLLTHSCVVEEASLSKEIIYSSGRGKKGKVVLVLN